MKRDLYFSKPLMNAAGSLGFTPEPRNGVSLEAFGAFVTNPISLRARLPAARPAMIEFPGGFLLHNGLPNPGFSAVLKNHSAAWKRSSLPMIVNLMADRAEETQQMVRALESAENVMAVELGFAPLLSDDIMLVNLEMCRGELPLIFSLPLEQVLSLGPRLIQEGAAAISIAPPRGTLMTPAGERVSGRLFGPALFPRILDIVLAAAQLEIPIIASAGIWSARAADETLSAGAIACAVDARLWIPRELNPNQKSPVN